MSKMIFMHVGDRWDYLSHDRRSLILREALGLLYPIKQISTRAKLCHYIKLAMVLKELINLNNIRVIEFGHYFNLIHHILLFLDWQIKLVNHFYILWINIYCVLLGIPQQSHRLQLRLQNHRNLLCLLFFFFLMLSCRRK